MPKQYPEDFKKQVVQFYENGQIISSICQEYQIAQSTFYRWIKEHRLITSDQLTYSPADFYRLSQHLTKTSNQLEIIKLSKCISSLSLKKRLSILVELYENFNHFSVHEICDAMEVARGTFYNHIFRKADRSQYIQEQNELIVQVQQIFDESEQRFGAEKIRVVLAEKGIRVGAKRIREIMNELDLVSIRLDAKRGYRRRQAYHRQNLVNREFKAERPNRIWASDITCFKVKSKWMFLCVVLDLFSRRVIGYKVSQKSSTHIVTAAFRSAYTSRGEPKGVIFHSDRGSQYVSLAFTKLLHDCEVKQSYSATGRPCDNAVAETFFATFKKEEAYRRDYSSEQDFRRGVEKFIRFYNENRPHMTLAYKTPVRFEENYYASKKNKGVSEKTCLNSDFV